ncbi:MAG: hypothetical protein Q9161_008485 [Pseudevernia consocians]
MPRLALVRHRAPNGRFLSSRASASVTATTVQHTVGLFGLPPELRLAVYKCLFSITDKCTLRRLEDVASRKEIKLSNSSILTTCKMIYTEALPLFYASRTFHYPAELDGLFRQPRILEAHLQRVKHISIEVSVTTKSIDKLDAIVGRHVATIIQHCEKLSSFTLHVIPAIETDTRPLIPLALIPICLGEGAAAEALRTLRPRIHQLSIVTFGNWDTLHHLREAIADDACWVEGGKCYGWPGLTLTPAQSAAVGVKQRRYTLAGSETFIHPHSQCIRVFHTFRSGGGGESEDRGTLKGSGSLA